MEIKYSISLWNYLHYTGSPGLEQVVKHVREQGCGIELWGSYQGENLYDGAGRSKLKHLLKDMTVTLHTVGASNSLDLQRKQIDAAAELGAGLIVLHPDDLVLEDKQTFDVSLARDAVAYAGERNVKLALENGELSFLTGAIEKVEGLGICLDVGHVYFTSDSMEKFLTSLKHRLIHLHIQDVLPEIEKKLPWRGADHYIPGTGGIPAKDWELFARTLKEIDFKGIAVFEIQPRNPLQTALLGKKFMQEILRSTAV